MKLEHEWGDQGGHENTVHGCGRGVKSGCDGEQSEVREVVKCGCGSMW